MDDQSQGQLRVFPDGRLDARNAARYLGLSTKTLAMYRCHGVGPEFVKRGRIFYFKVALDSWIAAGKRPSAVPNAS